MATPKSVTTIINVVFCNNVSDQNCFCLKIDLPRPVLNSASAKVFK